MVHGSLEYARYPVMVGHCEGATLKGAEAFVDERLQGLLSKRQMIGQYPQQPGEAVFVPPRRGRQASGGHEAEAQMFPPGAYVLGLGPPGELTHNSLVLSVKAALVERGIELYDVGGESVDQLVEFGVASVLVGAFPIEGLNVEASLVAIVEGLLAANDTFRRFEAAAKEAGRPTSSVRVTALEVIERYADRAELAAHAVCLLPQLLDRVESLDDLIENTEVVVETRPGGLPHRAPLEEAEAAWRRVMVTVSDAPRNIRRSSRGAAPPTLELDVIVMGRLARADRLRHLVDSVTVDNLVAAAIGEASPDAQVTNTLWELLLPVELKEGVISTGRLQLVVDEQTANYPWELMASRGRSSTGQRTDLSVARAGLLRQFREGSGGQRFRARRAVADHALVIGNPPFDPAHYARMTGQYQPLPGAAAEAVEVRDVLTEWQFNVTPLIWDANGYQAGAGTDLDRDAIDNSGRAVINALFKDDYRIVHVAAHGAVSDEPAESGAIIGGGMFLTANVIRQLAVPPDVVFLNCCHLAKVGFNRLAAGVARELLAIGVQVVVAAGWAVDDRAAETFAAAFYRSLLSGEDYGDAVRDARKAAHGASTSLTWGAYQCYGDPGYRLTLRGGTPTSRPARPVSRTELLRNVQTVAVRASDVGRPDTGELEKRRGRLVGDLEVLEAESEESWFDAEVSYEFGQAYAALGVDDRAVHWYRQALDRGRDYPVVLLEQLANREIRLAQQVARGDSPQFGRLVKDDWNHLMEAACEHLAAAGSLPETSERHAIQASLHKKMATLVPDDRPDRMRRAADAYRTAHEINKQRAIEDPDAKRDSYPALNWLQLSSLAEWSSPPDPPLTSELDDICRWLARPTRSDTGRRQDVQESPMFWDNARAGDLALTEMMVAPAGAGVCREAVTKVAKAYLEAFATRSCWAERSSVIEHLTDLRTIADGSPGLAEAIGLVIDELSTWQHQHIDTIVDEGPQPGSAGPPKLRASQPKSEQLSVEMLPVADGDCIWIEYGQPQRKHRIIIDGGPGANVPGSVGRPADTPWRRRPSVRAPRRHPCRHRSHRGRAAGNPGTKRRLRRHLVQRMAAPRTPRTWRATGSNPRPPHGRPNLEPCLRRGGGGRPRHSRSIASGRSARWGQGDASVTRAPAACFAQVRMGPDTHKEACQAWQRRTCTANPGRPSKGILTARAGRVLGRGSSATTAQLPTDRASPLCSNTKTRLACSLGMRTLPSF